MSLRGCRTVGNVEDALRQLPESLDKTYDRILNDISKEDRERAHCVLQLLACAFRTLTVDEIAAAIAVNCKEEKVDSKLRLREPTEILEICSSLIELSGFFRCWYSLSNIL